MLYNNKIQSYNQNKEELADTKGVNRIRKPKKHRQLNDQRNNKFNLTICHFRCSSVKRVPV